MMKLSMTRGSDSFKRLFIKRIPSETNQYLFSFSFQFRNSKFTSQVQFKSDTSIMAYQQYDQNSCCVGILSSDLKASNDFAD